MTMEEKELRPIPQERIEALNRDIEEGLADMESCSYKDGHKVMRELIKKYST